MRVAREQSDRAVHSSDGAVSARVHPAAILQGLRDQPQRDPNGEEARERRVRRRLAGQDVQRVRRGRQVPQGVLL